MCCVVNIVNLCMPQEGEVCTWVCEMEVCLLDLVSSTCNDVCASGVRCAFGRVCEMEVFAQLTFPSKGSVAIVNCVLCMVGQFPEDL